MSKKVFRLGINPNPGVGQSEKRDDGIFGIYAETLFFPLVFGYMEYKRKVYVRSFVCGPLQNIPHSNPCSLRKKRSIVRGIFVVIGSIGYRFRSLVCYLSTRFQFLHDQTR